MALRHCTSRAGAFTSSTRGFFFLSSMGVWAVENVPGRIFTRAESDGSVRIKAPKNYVHEEVVFGVVRIVGARIDCQTKDWVVPPERVELFNLVMGRVCI